MTIDPELNVNEPKKTLKPPEKVTVVFVPTVKRPVTVNVPDRVTPIVEPLALRVIAPVNVAILPVVRVPAAFMTSVPVPETAPVTPVGSVQFPETVRIFAAVNANVPTMPVQLSDAQTAFVTSTVTVFANRRVESIMTVSDAVGTPAPPTV